MNKFCKVILATAAVAAFAAPAMAAATNKLMVKDSLGATNALIVADDGSTTSTSKVPAATLLIGNYNDLNNGAGSQVRHGVRGDGITYWQLGSPTAEIGQIMYTTPANYPGISLYTVGWTNPFVWADFGSYTAFYFVSNKNLPTLNVASSAAPENGRVGIGQIVPTQKLEVNGGIRLNPTAVTTGSNAPTLNFTTAAPAKPACDINARGTLWYVNNGASKDNLQLCVYTGAAYAWANLY